MKTPPAIVVLISGNGSNLQALIDTQARGELFGEIAAVISNRANAFGLERAKAANIGTQVVDHTQYADRESYDKALAAVIDSYQPDLLVLAGYMRILSDDFVNHYAGRMLNIHPSLLPKYRGLNTHQRAIDAGDKQHGVSVHFVTPELDGGPVIIQASVDIENADTAESLAKRVQTQEHLIYPLAVKWFCQGKLQLQDDAVILDGEILKKPTILQV